MNDIDLIPKVYREQIIKLDLLKVFGFVFIFLVVTTSVAYGAIEYVKRETNAEIVKLSKMKEITSHQRNELRKLKKEKKDLEHQWTLLTGLRSAVAAEDLFISIDKSLQGIDIWFTSMKFQRAEVEIEEKNLIETGYFIIITPDEEKKSLAIGTKMLITGEAPNHSTLSSFVKNLLDQPEILDAKVLETSTNKANKNSFVRFNLDITVNLENKMG